MNSDNTFREQESLKSLTPHGARKRQELPASELAAVPFQLLPHQTHDRYSHEKLLHWQSRAAGEGQFPHLHVWVRSPAANHQAAEIERSMQLLAASLRVQSYQGFSLYVDRALGRILESSSLMPSALKELSYTVVDDELPVTGDTPVVHLSPTLFLHPQALYIIARSLLLNPASVLYSNAVRFARLPNGAISAARSFIRRPIPSPFSFLHPEAVGELVVAHYSEFHNSAIQDSTPRSPRCVVASAVGRDLPVKRIPLALACSEYSEQREEYPAGDIVNAAHLLGHVNLGSDVSPPRLLLSPPEVPEIQVIIPFKDKVELTAAALQTLADQSVAARLRVTLIDNGSKPSSVTELQKRGETLFGPRFSLLSVSAPFNFAMLNNIAASQERTPLILFMNNDVELTHPQSVEALTRWIALDGIGVVGGVLSYPTGGVQHAGIYFASVRPANLSDRRQWIDCPREVDAVSFALALVRRSVFQAVGGLDEWRCPNGFGDALFCETVRKQGWSTIMTPEAKAIHHESPSRGRTPEDLELWDLEEGGVHIADLYSDLAARHHCEEIPLSGSSMGAVKGTIRRVLGQRGSRALGQVWRRYSPLLRRGRSS